MSDGCTLGAKKLPGRFYLFKNRDLTYSDFRNNLVFDERIFAVTGVDIATGTSIGASVGVNSSGLAVCSSTVLINNEVPYDLLLEQILREADDLDSAANIVQSQLDSGSRYQWCNIVIASLEEVGVIEIGDGISAVERDEVFVTRANHHLKLDTTDRIQSATSEEREAGGPLDTSQHRRQTVSKMIADAAALTDFISIVSSHSSSKGFNSICRHKDADSGGVPYLGETSYSYIIEGLDLGEGSLDLTFHVSRSNPCSNPFKSIPVEFDSNADIMKQFMESFP